MLLTVLALLAATPWAQSRDGDADLVTPNFKDVDIRQVVEMVSETTGRNFLLDARVKGNVTMISDSPMSHEEFYETFLSILEVYGFVAVPSGNLTKIIPDTNARQVPGPDGVGGYKGDDIVTQVISVENVGAAQLVPILRPLVPQYGHLAAHPASNMLIIADRAANVARLKKIIRRIDQSSDEDIEVIPMQYASATDVVRILTTLSQANARGGDASSTPPSLVADERTNSVLISGEKAQRLRFRTLIAHLDTPLEEGGNTQVVYLRYANAEDLAGKLTEQVRGTAGPGGQGTTAGGQQTQNPVIIWADPDTNALVVTAPPKVMRSLRSVIDKIDIRRAQVHVEAVLVELLGDNNADLGITWILDGREKGPAVGFTNFGETGALSYAGALLADDPVTAAASLGSAASGITIGGGRFREGETNFGVLLNAIEGLSNTNILSTPSIVTMDNEEAEITIGQEVPFLTGSFSNTGGTQGAVNPFQTIQREDVGIKLKITPQINEGDAVILAIELEASSVSETSGNAQDLITNQRQISQKVIVDDGGVIVLGGLIDDTLTETESRVPIVSRIPVLGALFRSRGTSYSKRNLMIFIRPKIMRDGTQTMLETNSKYNYIRNIQRSRQGNARMLPNMPRPVLPTLDDVKERGFYFDEAPPADEDDMQRTGEDTP